MICDRLALALRRIDLALRLAFEATGFKARNLEPHDRTLFRYLALRVSVEKESSPLPLSELKLPGPRRPRAVSDADLARVASALPPVDDLPVPPDPVAALALRASVPDFLARRLSDELGVERAGQVLEVLNRPPRLDLRANRLLTTRGALIPRLQSEGVTTQACAFAPDGLIAEDRAHLFGRAHQEGLFELQDEGSQLIALLCGAKPGETAIDWCAGSGGKSLALAADVGPSGRVIAWDAVAHRLAELPARARRARAQRIVQVAAEPPAVEADVVLVDAPCSGIGSLRREVDLRWRVRETELEQLPERQLAILREAARRVRRGGRLVYATCSPFRAENEAVVATFLAGDSGFRQREPHGVLPESAASTVSEAGFLRVWPDRHGGGAFFGALLFKA